MNIRNVFGAMVASFSLLPGFSASALADTTNQRLSSSLIINEVDADTPGTDIAEFVELYDGGVGNSALDAYVLVFFNGSDDASYEAFDLDGMTTDADGYFVLCGNNANVANCDMDVMPDSNLVQNGADAVALFMDSASNFPNDTAITTTNLIDAIVYDTNDGDDAALLVLLNANQPQVNEGEVGTQSTESNQRCANGSGGGRNTSTYTQATPTPGAENMCAGAPPQVTSVSPANLATNVDPTDDVVLNFNEAVDIAIDAISVDCTAGGNQTFPTVAETDVSLITINPIDFTFGDSCTITATAASITDADATPLDGDGNGTSGDDFSSSFTVALANPIPVITSTVPADSAVGVDGTADIAINFSENIDATANAVTLVCNNTPVSFTGLPATNVASLTINPDINLTDGEMCTVTAVAAEITETGGTATPAANSSFSFLVGFPIAEIFEIQGNGLASAFDGQRVTTEDNIVTALDTNGFYIQTPDNRDDNDVNTSNALFVFTGGAPTVAVGDQIDITADLVEFNDLTEFGTPGTQIINIDSSGNALPTAVVFDENLPSTDPTFEYCSTDLETAKFECIENMLIDIPQAFVSAPFTGFFSNTQRNDLLVVRAGSARGFREPGIEFPGLGGTIPTWDGNPELFEIFQPGLGLTSMPISGGSEIAVQGVIFQFGSDYQLNPILIDIVNENVIPQAASVGGEDTVKVGSANLFRLFNDFDDPGPEDDGQVADPAFYQTRLDKISQYIRQDLNAPDIVVLQEIERIDVLNDLVARITADDAAITYTPQLVEGNDVGGIDVAFLYRSNVTMVTLEQLGAAELLSVDGSLLHDRPPLRLQADVTVDGQTMRLNLLAVHNRSFGGIDDPTDGARVRQKRLEQANSIAVLTDTIQNSAPGEAVIILGDFNAFQFTDGFVDAIGQIAGTAVEDENLLWTAPLFAASPLTQAVSFVPSNEQYSFQFNGNSQVLDNALLNDEALTLFIAMDYARGNADSPLVFEDDGTTSRRAADHDGFVLTFSLDPENIFSNGFEAQPQP